MAAGRRDVGVPPIWGVGVRADGLKEIETYLSRRKNTVANYIATCTILGLYMDMGRRPKSRAPKQWK